uniref:Immunoglobulin V-set domain-containing protein n=1 Tax=Scophthalmus maximus TaxID=52904 RepID=A0A8D3E6U9_SCOMX
MHWLFSVLTCWTHVGASALQVLKCLNVWSPQGTMRAFVRLFSRQKKVKTCLCGCRLVPSVDLKDLTLEVTRTDVDKEVYVCRLGKEIAEEQSSQYKHRTRLRQDSITGTFTLTISSVNTSDSGTYQWYSPQHEAMCRFNLTVCVATLWRGPGPGLGSTSSEQVSVKTLFFFLTGKCTERVRGRRRPDAVLRSTRSVLAP